MKRTITAVFLLVFFVLELSSKDIYFNHLTINDGLPSAGVRGIVQDAFGFIWISTDEGICRYDGQEIIVYRDILEGKAGVMPSVNKDLVNAPDSSIWFASYKNGVFRYDHHEEKFINHRHERDDTTSLLSNTVRTIFMDSRGYLWVAHNEGVSIIHTGTGTVTRHLFEDQINQFFEDSKNNIWLLGRETLYKINNLLIGDINADLVLDAKVMSGDYNGIVEDQDSNIWIFDDSLIRIRKGIVQEGIEYEEYSFSVSEGSSINSVEFLSKDEILFGTSLDGVYLFNTREERTVLHYNQYSGTEKPLISNGIDGVVKDGYGNVWMFTEGVLHLFDTTNRSFIAYMPETGGQGAPAYLANQVLIDLFVYTDRQGLNWIQSREGLMFFKPGGMKFDFIKFPQYSDIHAIHLDDFNNIWIGNRKNIVIYDQDDKTFTKVNQHFENPAKTEVVFTIHRVDSFHYLVGGGRLYFVRFDPANKTLTRLHSFSPEYYDPANNISDWLPGRIFRDSKGYLWICTTGSISIIHEDSVYTKTTRFRNLDTILGSTNTPWAVCEDDNNIYWIGTKNGLVRYDDNTRTCKWFNDEDEIAWLAGINNIKCIQKDKWGDIWIGSEGGGLVKYRKKDGKFINFNTFDGLPSNTVYGILPDEIGNLWLSTNLGLSCFNPVNEKFTNYSYQDGILDNSFTLLGYYKPEASSDLYFGTSSGVVKFNPYQVSGSSYDPDVFFTSLRLDGKEIKPGDVRFGKEVIRQSIVSTREITLSYKENNIYISFAALDLESPDDIKFRYKLEGVSEKWIYRDKGSHSVSFFDLAPGNYSLSVMATNRDGIWGSKTASLLISIAPPFWQTAWFRILAVLVVILLVSGIYFYRIGQVRRRNRELEDKVKARTAEIEMQKEELQIQTEQLASTNATKDRLFSIIAHDLRNPVHALSSLLQVMIKDAKNRLNEKDFNNLVVMNNSAGSVSKLLENLLTWSRSQSHTISIDLKPVNLYDLVLNISKLMQGNIEQKSIELIIDCDESHVVHVDRNMVMTIIRNLLSNAIKFTPKNGTIHVYSTTSDDRVQLNVSDTGVGMTKAQMDQLFAVQKTAKTTVGTSGEEGTGLGLIICKDFVEKIDGQIHVQSEIGKGTTFTIDLKRPDSSIKVEHDQPENDALEPTEKPVQLIKRQFRRVNEEVDTILVVDDNKTLLETYESILSPYYDVVTAIDGDEGWGKAIEIIPDMVITDLVMPKLSGYELSERLKSDPKTSHIPIILLTAESAENRIIEGYKREVDDYITKPFNPEILMVRIENLLKIRQKLRKIFSHSIDNIDKVDVLKPTDKRFLQEVIAQVLDNISDSSFTYEKLSDKLGYSRSVTYRKIKAITGLSVNQYITNIRLKEAAKLLTGTSFSVSEVAYKVGFNDPRYFTRCFNSEFQQSPTNYRKKFE